MKGLQAAKPRRNKFSSFHDPLAATRAESCLAGFTSDMHRLPPGEDQAVDRKRAGASNDDGEQKRQGEQVILKSFAMFHSRPIHEESVMCVHERDGNCHVADQSESGNAGEEANQQTQAAKKFRANGEESERRGNVHPVGEETHGTVKTVPSEPAKHFLRAVRKEDDAED
jgi:hypothetical protein